MNIKAADFFSAGENLVVRSTARPRCGSIAFAVAAMGLLLPLSALAQQPPAAPPPAAPPPAASSEWEKLPRMNLDRQFAGPLRDTVIQRWHDPVDGTVCYIYLPITAPHSPPVQSGFVQYGGNVIGSVSCFASSRPPPPKR